MKLGQQIQKHVNSFFKKRRTEEDLFNNIKRQFLVDGKLVYAGELLKIAYQKYSHKIAIIDQEKEISYKELYFRSCLLSQKLKENGVQPRDKVLLYFENSADFHIAYFAIWMAGAVAVPVNIYLHEKELAYIIKDCVAKVAMVSVTFKEKWDGLFSKKHLQQKDLPFVLNQDDIDWQKQVPEKVEEFTMEALRAEELCVLLYTSGTTGLPKGVMLSSKNILINTMQVYARLMLVGKSDNERFFSVLPLFHSFAQNACLWLPTMLGATVIIVRKIDRRLILEGLRKKPTLFFGFPALYGLLCLLRTAPLGSIRLFISGADLLPDKIRSAFSIIYGRKICSGYGLTEASPVVAFNQDNDGQPTEVVGDSLVGISYEIRDDNGVVLGANQVGNLWVKGDNIMMGYYNAPESTEKVLKDGWLDTGDFASFDENQKLAIKGRHKDLIIHKGFNIYPQEIENILMSHPEVIRAAVVGRQEAVSGEIPIAFVQVKSERPGIEQSLKELCAGNLASYKIPRKFVCLDDLPLGATGKIDKKRLQL